MGIFSSLVTHEIGHTMGLDDKDGNRDGITDPNYPGDVGIMKYQGVYLQAISDADVKTIINYAKNVLATPEKTKTTDAKVILIEQKGKSDGNNPLGLKSEGSTQPATNTGN